jgi:predicted  nucleic acid-binding Zn-ribbon protein
MWIVCSKCLGDYNDKQFNGCPNCEGKKQKIIEEEIEKIERQQIIDEYFNQINT